MAFIYLHFPHCFLGGFEAPSFAFVMTYITQVALCVFALPIGWRDSSWLHFTIIALFKGRIAGLGYSTCWITNIGIPVILSPIGRA